jgi:hypothetical protein
LDALLSGNAGSNYLSGPEKEIVVTDIYVEHMKSVKTPEERKTKEVKLQGLRKG